VTTTSLEPRRRLLPVLRALPALGLASAFLLATRAAAQPGTGDEPAKHEVAIYHLDKKGLAIDGYDPVAYFEEGGGEPTKGSEKITLEHRGVTYRFATKRHRELFAKTPERYEPMYGGWCAYTMAAENERVSPSPKNYLVENGHLYLFFKGWFGNGRKAWLKQGSAKLKPEADAHWGKRVHDAKKLREENERKRLGRAAR